MSVRPIVWAVIGMAAGVTQAASLWRSAHAKAPGWSVVWRLPGVGAVLVSAALAHALLGAAIGWAAGLTSASAVYLARKRRWM